MTINTLGAGETITLQSDPWVANGTSPTEVHAIADVFDRVNETDETNNDAVILVDVRPPPDEGPWEG